MSQSPISDRWWEDAQRALPLPDHWLVQQTHLTLPQILRWISTWKVMPGSEWVDWGCGLGMQSVILAQTGRVHVTGVDLRSDYVQLASTRAMAIQHTPVTYAEGDVQSWVPRRPVEGMMTRFVLQYFTEDQIREIAKHWRSEEVARPGAQLRIEDVDDGLWLDDPPVPKAWQRVLTAFQDHQQMQGGDRHVGRKLPRLLAESGWTIRDVRLHPQTSWGWQRWDDPATQWEIQRLRPLVEQGMIDRDVWDEGFRAWQAALPRWTTLSVSTVRIHATA